MNREHIRTKITEQSFFLSDIDQLTAEARGSIPEEVRTELSLLSDNRIFSGVEITILSPTTEQYTGGFFTLTDRDSSVIPTVAIMLREDSQYEKLKTSRRFSAEILASLLGLSFEALDARTLRLFIIAHEFGHAKDFIVNYGYGHRKDGTLDIKRGWLEYQEAALSFLPIPFCSPAELAQDLEGVDTLDAFFNKFPNLQQARERWGQSIRSIEGLMQEQEHAYRTSPYEHYADQFAVDFLRTHQHLLTPGVVMKPAA